MTDGRTSTPPSAANTTALNERLHNNENGFSHNELSRFSSAGVNPSREWLAACHRHLVGDNNTNGSVSDDLVLHQILHADLRDVVNKRRTSHNNNEHRDRGGVSVLRDAILKSLSSLQNMESSVPASSRSQAFAKEILPSSFRCLVQVEELLDVSLNAEDRIKHGPSSSSSPTPTGNQRLRCLKLALSDGYDNDFGDDDDDAVGSGLIVAMEESPIENLSVHSEAGIKVLLQGSIVIRHGVLMLHGGNATVLGGCVPSLLPIQKKAVDMAKKMSGVGVDPTVKALIWNPLTGLEEDEDEGEGESRDIPIPTVTPPALSPALSPPVNSVSSLTSSSSRTSIEQHPQPPPVQREGQHHSVRLNQRSSSETRNMDSIAGSADTRMHPPTIATAIATTPKNPYAMRTNTRTTTDMGIRTPHIGDQHSTHSTTTSAPTDMPNTPTNPATAPNSHPTVHTTTTPIHHKNNAEPDQQHRATILSPTALTIILSFSELHSLLEQCKKDPATYNSYKGKTFVVPSKMKGPHLGFNIEKNKNKSKKNKYNYVMTCTWCGPHDEDGTIVCKLASPFLEKYFGMPPSEMRKLSRENRPRSQALVNEGGKKVVLEMKTLASFRMELLLSSHEEFLNMDNVDGTSKPHPIMLVTGRDS